MFFDLEGDPYVGTDGGIEYLWGWWVAGPATNASGRTTKTAEKAAFESSSTRSARCAPSTLTCTSSTTPRTSASKLRSLSVEYATREAEVDDLLRDDVARRPVRASCARACRWARRATRSRSSSATTVSSASRRRVREGGGSIIAYETWLETGDAELLEAIRAYNEEDCRSTLSLRDWLLDEMRPEAAAEFGVDFEDLRTPEPEEEHGPAGMDARRSGADRAAH